MEPIQHYKTLVLFEGQHKAITKKPTIEEIYNELVFVEPNP